MATTRKTAGTVTAKGMVRYNAFVVLDQDLELLRKSIPSEFDGLVGFCGSLAIALVVAMLTCSLPEWLTGVFGTVSALSSFGAIIRQRVVRKRRSEVIELIERIKENKCHFDPQGL
jgi:hypothetical protein